MAVTSGHDDWMLLNTRDNNRHVNIVGNDNYHLAYTIMITTSIFDIIVNECDRVSSGKEMEKESRKLPTT